MNIQETIIRILSEEEKKKDLSVPVKKLIEYFLMQSKDKEYVCDYKLELGKFATKHSGERYQRLKVTLYFDSGHGSKNWPMTMAVRYREERIMNELQDLILKFVGIIVDMYSSSTPNCKKMNDPILSEDSQLPVFIRRNNSFSEEDIIHYLKKFAIKSFEPGKKIEVIISKACGNTAYEILAAISSNIDDKTFRDAEKKLKSYLVEKYGDDIVEYIKDFYNESGDEQGAIYQFRKHAERNGGNGFTDSFHTWNQLLKAYADWFPNLDWKELKDKLDSMKDKQPLLIATPEDKFNSMNYYFSLLKMDKKGGSNLNENITKVLKEELSLYYRRRWNMIKKVYRTTSYYMMDKFKLEGGYEMEEFTEMFFFYFMDEMMEINKSNPNSYDDILKVLKDAFTKDVQEMWKALKDIFPK